VWPKKPARHTSELLTGRTIMPFSHICSSVTLQRNQLIFAVQRPVNVITSHSKFQLNRIKYFQDMNLRNMAEFLCFFLWFFCVCVFLFFFFSSNKKSCHKMQTQQDSVSAHFGIKFGCNTTNSHKVINNRAFLPTRMPFCCTSLCSVFL